MSVQQVEIDFAKALQIACKFRIYAYDAYLLQCATRFDCPLLALDRKLAEVATMCGIVVLGGKV